MADEHATEALVKRIAAALQSLKPVTLPAAAICPGYCAALGAEAANIQLDLQPAKQASSRRPRRCRGIPWSCFVSGARWCSLVQVSIVGSYTLGTACRPGAAVDVAVVLPRACFKEKDHLNHRYHVKKALFLSHAAGLLRKELKGMIDGVSLEVGQLPVPSLPAIRFTRRLTCVALLFASQLLGGDPRRPCLVLQPSRAKVPSAAGLMIRLLPCAEPDTFAPARLAPGRNSLRSHADPTAAAAPKAPSSGEDAEAAAKGWLPTPHYNQSVLADLLVTCPGSALALAVQAALGASPRYAEGLILLKCWARAQGLGGLVTGSVLAALVAHLHQSSRLLPAMAPVQVFRAVMSFLADCSKAAPLSTGFAMSRTASAAAAPGPGVPAFAAHFPVVFVDPSGHVNLTEHWTAADRRRVQLAAMRTVPLVAAGVRAPEESFDAVFLAGRSQAAAADYAYTVRLPARNGESPGRFLQEATVIV